MTSSFEDLTDYYRQAGLFKALNSEFESKVADLPRDKHDIPLAGTFPKKKPTRRATIFEEYIGRTPEKLITKSTIPVAEKFPSDSSSYKLALDQKKGKTIYQLEKEKNYNNPEMLRFLYGFTPSTRSQEESCVNLMEVSGSERRMIRNVPTEELISFYENNDSLKDYNRNVVEYPPSEELLEQRAPESPSTVLRIFVTPDSKEEILTVTSPVPGDDFTDSGIENNGNFQSPTTSIDYSPRSDRFEERPSSRKTVTFDLDNLSKPPAPKLDQVVIGLRVDQNPTNKVKETAARFDAGRVAAKPIADEPKPDAVKEDKKGKRTSRTVALGIELCREQNGHVTACKFPLRRSFDSVCLSASSPPPAPILKKSDEMVFTQLAPPLKTVDIPLGGPLPDSNGIMTINLEVDHGPSGRHDFGFTVKGGKDRHEPVTVEKVMVNSAADRAGLQVGDQILDVNGESVLEKYHKTVKRMISEATWVGAIEIKIRRPSYLTHNGMNGYAKANGTIPTGQVDYSTSSFNEKRTMFDQAEREANSYAQFVQKKKMQTPSKWINEPRRAYTREGPTDGFPDRTYSPSMSSISPQSSTEYRTSTLESNKSFASNKSLGSTTKSYQDYRVTAIHDKPDPGKLTDFIPEVERGGSNTVSYLDGSNTNQHTDQPKLIRNYNYNIVKSNFDIPPQQPIAHNNNNAPKIHKWVNSSSLPRDIRTSPPSDASATDDDTQPGRSFLRKHLRHITPFIDQEDDEVLDNTAKSGNYANIRHYQRAPSPSTEAPIYAVPPKMTDVSRRSRSTEPFAQPKPEKEIHIQRGTVTYETRSVPYERHIPVRLTGHPSSFKFKRQPLQNQYSDVEDQISDASYRFYDRSGQEMGRARSVEDLLARREREVVISPAPTLTEIMDAKEWRHIVREQRLPNPGNPYSKSSFENNPKFDVIQKSVGSMKDLRPVNGTLPKMTERVIAETVSKASPEAKANGREEPETVLSESTTSSGEKLFAVSGRHKCAHCDMELGRGAAMIIESLKLFYHLSCFRCYVCNMALGNGTQGADVRVRGTKLHCQRCYSSDENGKFSRI